jgi:trimethylamine:corrinoid methyltransferase-like protein
MGKNAPLEYAAMLAITNANILAGLAILTAMNPDNMYFRYICPPHMVNPHNHDLALMGNVNQIVFSWATRQLADYYGFKYTITNSGFSDSMENDFQAGFEIGVTAALAIAAGITSNGVKGVVGMDQAVSLGRLVADHEMYSYLNEAFGRRVDVNENTLQSDRVDAAGIGGDFLDCLEDASRVREVYGESPVFFSGDYETWKKGPRSNERLGSRIEQLIAEGFTPAPVLDTEKLHMLDKAVEKHVDDRSFLPRLKTLIEEVAGVAL